MREIIERSQQKDLDAKQALNMYVYTAYKTTSNQELLYFC